MLGGSDPMFITERQSCMLAVKYFLLLLSLCWQESAVEVQQLQSPDSEKGKWQRIDAQQLTIAVDGIGKSLPLTSLKSVRFATATNDAPATGDRPMAVWLSDGSLIRPEQITGNGQGLEIELHPGIKIAVSANYIRSVQFQKLSDKQQTQWRAIQESRLSGDTLVVIRSPDAIDKIEGQILEVKSDSVSFDFSKQKIEAPRNKLAGLRFLTPPAQLQRVKAVVTDIYGNIYQTTLLNSGENSTIELGLACGAKVSLPVKLLANIDFSIGSVKYLAELSPIGSQRSNGFNFKAPIAGADQLFAPNIVRLSTTAGPSIRMLGSGSITYRVPDEYSQFAGKVYLAPDGEQFTPCIVEIRLESEVLWQGKLSHPSERLEFSVKVAADQRLQLNSRVESGYPVGDVIIWQEARLLK